MTYRPRDVQTPAPNAFASSVKTTRAISGGCVGQRENSRATAGLLMAAAVGSSGSAPYSPTTAQPDDDKATAARPQWQLGSDIETRQNSAGDKKNIPLGGREGERERETKGFMGMARRPWRFAMKEIWRAVLSRRDETAARKMIWQIEDAETAPEGTSYKRGTVNGNEAATQRVLEKGWREREKLSR